jgi:cathepsin E
MVMLLVTALASFVVLATSVAAEPSNRRLHSLSIAKHIDPKGKYYPVQRDRRRFTHLMNKDNRANSSNLVERAGEIPLTNVGSYHYEAKVGVGVPPTYCKSCVDFCLAYSLLYGPFLDSLIVDTGSADTWVGANARYVRTNTSVETADFIVSVTSHPDRWTSSNQKPINQGVRYGGGAFRGKFDFS